ncbi:hypothetical protein NQ314_002044 [Rhamnusium bicolor]|uniref:C2H2-type domain-containing protein n=1 Tax=Rhamnusium bicolor TaxID=1586634 RepID=A0AAV8ZRW2_9CUCU|nr:hypothetical protein NQ314_002044 [Rhamnusium bicolor]
MDLEQKNPEQILCKEDFQENQLKPKITKTGSQTGAKLDLRVGRPPSKQIKIAPKPEDNDVVVLFTNYTVEGEYINDHDYLINPYKRNKVLIEEGSQWYCMCYICHSKHHVYDHVPHMNTHESICKVCKVDLGNPYMLNVHVKVHTKPCKQCTERVSYGEWDTHLEQHFQDEIEFEKGLQKKIYHVRTRRKRPKKDDDAKEECQSEDLGQSSSVKTEEDSSNNEEWSSSGSSSKRLRKRKRRITNDEDIVEVERSSRVLRSNVRKSYSETESEDIISNDLHMMRNCLI